VPFERLVREASTKHTASPSPDWQRRS
jgi:hypothetical protein